VTRVTPLQFAVALALATLLNGIAAILLATDWRPSEPAEEPVYVNIIALGVGDSSGAGKMPQGVGLSAPGTATPADGPPTSDQVSPDDSAPVGPDRPALSDQADAERVETVPSNMEPDRPATEADPPRSLSPERVPGAVPPPTPRTETLPERDAASEERTPATSQVAPSRPIELPALRQELPLREPRNLPMRSPEDLTAPLPDARRPKEPDAVAVLSPFARPALPDLRPEEERQPETEITVAPPPSEPDSLPPESRTPAPEVVPPIARMITPETPAPLPAPSQPDIGVPIGEPALTGIPSPSPAEDEATLAIPSRPPQPEGGPRERMAEPIEAGEAFVTIRPAPPIQPSPLDMADQGAVSRPSASAAPIVSGSAAPREATPDASARVRAGASIAPSADERQADTVVANEVSETEEAPPPFPEITPPVTTGAAGTENARSSSPAASDSSEVPSPAPTNAPPRSLAARPSGQSGQTARQPAGGGGGTATGPRGLPGGAGPVGGPIPGGALTGAPGGTVVAGSPLDRYATNLHALIDAQKRYPRVSRQRREEGAVILRITIAPDGSLMDVVVEKAASDQLAEASIAAVRNAAGRFPPFPLEMPQEPLQFIVSVSFVLR